MRHGWTIITLSACNDMAVDTISKQLNPGWWPLITGRRFLHASSFKQAKTLLAGRHVSVGGLHDHGLAS